MDNKFLHNNSKRSSSRKKIVPKMTKQPKKIRLTTIILNYNSGTYLKDCLISLKKSTLKNPRVEIDHEILVVDNASSDNSLKLAKDGFKQAKYIVSKENKGFSAGNNIGVKKAKKNDYIFFLNPDTLVFPKTIITLIDFLTKNAEVGMANCKEELPDGTISDACHRGFPTPWRAFTHFSGLEKLFPKSKLFSGYTLGYKLASKFPHEIDSGSGSCMMVRAKAGRQIDWWDEDYFFYGEDLDFAYRLKQKGWLIYYLPNTKIIHFRGISSGIKKHSQKISTANRETKIKTAKASIQAMKIFYKKHYLNSYPRIVSKFVFFGIDILEKMRIIQLYLK